MFATMSADGGIDVSRDRPGEVVSRASRFSARYVIVCEKPSEIELVTREKDRGRGMIEKVTRGDRWVFIPATRRDAGRDAASRDSRA